MLEFLKNNIGTIAVSILLMLIVGAIIVRIIKNKKQGKSSCGCGCSSCSMKGICHEQDREKSENNK